MAEEPAPVCRILSKKESPMRIIERIAVALSGKTAGPNSREPIRETVIAVLKQE